MTAVQVFKKTISKVIVFSMALLLYNHTLWAQNLPDSLKTKERQAFEDTVAARNELERKTDSITERKAPQNVRALSKDSTIIPYPNPKRAGLLSALVPGMGQVYNKQYWKLPIVYAGLGVAGYYIYSNNKNYRIYRQAYIARIDGDPTTRDDFEVTYPYPDALKQRQDYFKKYLDMSVLITGVGYVLQILDAVTFAYLKDFDVSRDISMKASPSLQWNAFAASPALGLQLRIGLK